MGKQGELMEQMAKAKQERLKKELEDKLRESGDLPADGEVADKVIDRSTPPLSYFKAPLLYSSRSLNPAPALSSAPANHANPLTPPFASPCDRF